MLSRYKKQLKDLILTINGIFEEKNISVYGFVMNIYLYIFKPLRIVFLYYILIECSGDMASLVKVARRLDNCKFLGRFDHFLSGG